MKDGTARRTLLVGKIIDAVGTGMYAPFTLVFFQHVTRLPLTEIGAVLGGAGLIGMAALPLAGTAVDVWGARRMQVIGYGVRGAAFIAYPFAHTVATFAVLAVVTAAAARSFPAIQQAVVSDIVTGPARDRFNALSRSVNNAGLGAGALLASLFLAIDGDTGFFIAAWLNAASFLIAGALNARLPRTARPVTVAGRRTGYRAVLVDRPFLGLIVANLFVSFGYAALSVLLPVYAVLVLHAPAWIAGVMFGINTALCAFAGVPVATLARRIGRRTRVAAAGAAVFAVSFAGFAALGAQHHAGVLLIALELALVTVVYTIGELVHSPASTTLSQSAAPEAGRGRYLAAYQMSWSLSAALAPALFTALLGIETWAPWLVLVGIMLVGATLLVRLESRLPVAATSDDLVAGERAGRPGRVRRAGRTGCSVPDSGTVPLVGSAADGGARTNGGALPSGLASRV